MFGPEGKGIASSLDSFEGNGKSWPIRSKSPRLVVVSSPSNALGTESNWGSSLHLKVSLQPVASPVKEGTPRGSRGFQSCIPSPSGCFAGGPARTARSRWLSLLLYSLRVEGRLRIEQGAPCSEGSGSRKLYNEPVAGNWLKSLCVYRPCDGPPLIASAGDYRPRVDTPRCTLRTGPIMLL